MPGAETQGLLSAVTTMLISLYEWKVNGGVQVLLDIEKTLLN